MATPAQVTQRVDPNNMLHNRRGNSFQIQDTQAFQALVGAHITHDAGTVYSRRTLDIFPNVRQLIPRHLDGHFNDGDVYSKR